MKLSDINIPKGFLAHPPAEVKLDACRAYYRKHGEIDRELVVSGKHYLVDGYVGYLVLMENNVQEHEVSIRKKSGKQEKKPVTYITACHEGNPREYIWKVTDWTKNTIFLKPGCRALVKSSQGNKVVNIVKVETLDEPPVRHPIKKVIKCLKS